MARVGGRLRVLVAFERFAAAERVDDCDMRAQHVRAAADRLWQFPRTARGALACPSSCVPRAQASTPTLTYTLRFLRSDSFALIPSLSLPCSRQVRFLALTQPPSAS